MYIMNYFLLPEIINTSINVDNIELKYNDSNKNIVISKTLHFYLNKLKQEIDHYTSEWDNIKKYTNTYEFIHTTIPNLKIPVSKLKPISRSFYKMIEICNMFNLLEDYNDCGIKSFHIAEGPGGFIEALNYMRKNDKDLYYGMTLIDNNPNVPGWEKNKNFLFNDSKVILEYGKDKTGNILHKENLIYCYEKYNNSFDIITGDGGFDFSVNFNMQETMASNLIFAEMCFAISTQKVGGTFILKIFDIFSKTSLDIIYFLNLFYKQIHIVKPHSSRLANSEKYIVCSDFKQIDNYKEIIKKIINNYDCLNNSDNLLSSFINDYENLYFINKLEEINAIFGQQQMENISYTLSMLYKNINLINKMDQLKNNNIQKCVYWCNKYNIPYNNIHTTDINENFFLKKRLKTETDVSTMDVSNKDVSNKDVSNKDVSNNDVSSNDNSSNDNSSNNSDSEETFIKYISKNKMKNSKNIYNSLGL